MKLSLGYMKWGIRARCSVFTTLDYHVNKMGVYVSIHAHTHTLIYSFTHLSPIGYL